MNIRWRLTLWYTAILFFILVIFSTTVYIGLSRNLIGTVDTHLQREAGQIIGSIKFEHEDDHDDEDKENYKKIDKVKLESGYIPEKGVFWRILDAKAQPLIDPGYFDGASFDSAVIKTDQAHLEYGELTDNTLVRLYTVPFVFERQGTGIVQVAESYHHVQDVQRQLLYLLAIGIPFTLLAASAGGWFLAANALGPIDRITRAAQQISANNLRRRLNLELPNDEVGRLAATFDQMLARLEDAFERQKRFIADASHEMRTPLTILKGDVEVTLNRPRSAEQYRETLEMVNQTSDRLTNLVQELFLLARADNNQYPLQFTPLDLAALLTGEVAGLMPQAVKKDVALHLDVPDKLFIEGDQDKLARLFMNVIDNAIKHSGSGNEVNVIAKIENGQAVVFIADTGPGISPEHLPHLFDRFYRVDKARSRRASTISSGAGLGLSIAQWLARVHGGRIEVSSQVGQGTTFTVWLPLKSAPVSNPNTPDGNL